MGTPREPGTDVDAVVAFSGGKDSTVSLYLARQKFKLNVRAVLVDNGFIPQAVIDNGRAFCERMEVQLVILPIEFASHVRELLRQDFKTGYPCYKCTELFHERIREYCSTNRINRVILGRNWWRWLEPEVRSVRRLKDERTGTEMQFISLPFALQLNEAVVRGILKEQGWRAVDIHGNSTNCLIPGMVEHHVWKRLGYHPELNLLSREVISGYLDKETARRQLSDIRDLSADLRRTIDEKLSAGAGR
jgi:PP-loop superfamily ATP-utilizing enzyme